MKIRVQTIDGDVDYYNLTRDLCAVSGKILMVSSELLRERYYPEYRLSDLIVTICEEA